MRKHLIVLHSLYFGSKLNLGAKLGFVSPGSQPGSPGGQISGRGALHLPYDVEISIYSVIRRVSPGLTDIYLGGCWAVQYFMNMVYAVGL